MSKKIITLQTLADKLDNLDSKVDNLGSRLDSKIDNLGSRLDSKIDALGSRLDSKIDALQESMDDGFALVKQGFDDSEVRFDRLEENQEHMKLRLDNVAYRFEFVELEQRVTRLEHQRKPSRA